jgi:hypothetical protein
MGSHHVYVIRTNDIVSRDHARNHASGSSRCKWLDCSRSSRSDAESSVRYAPFLSLYCLLTFRRKHLDYHVKPYLCPKIGCNRRAPTPKDLKRHLLSHGRSSEMNVYYCPHPECGHSLHGQEPPFPRCDNALRHIKQMHGGSSLKPMLGTNRQQPNTDYSATIRERKTASTSNAVTTTRTRKITHKDT